LGKFSTSQLRRTHHI